MLGEPLPDQSALVGAEVVGDQVDKTSRDGPLDLLQQLYVAFGVPGAGSEGQRLAVLYSESTEHPCLVRASTVFQGRFYAMAVRRPPRSRRERARGYRTELIDADHRRAGRWVSVELDYPRSFGTNSGSALSAHGRVRRQRTPSASRMRRTWLRPTSMPISLAASASASNVQYAAFASSSGWSPPPGSVSSLPGGSLESRAMMLERKIQSPGAWRLPASLRIFGSSSMFWGARACSSFGTISSLPARRSSHALMYTAFEERSTSPTVLLIYRL